MKLNHVLVAFGFRPKPKFYGYTIESFKLEKDGIVRFAQWQHPKCRPTRFDQSSVDELRNYLLPGDAVIDIGAHSGDTSVLFALAVGQAGKVFAVEPNRYVLPILEKNAALNAQAAPIEILPFAATDETATLTFNYSDRGYCNGGDLDRFGRLKHGHFYPLVVEGRNILAELRAGHAEWLPRIRLIKTDTEGNDQSVIAGFRDLILAARPYLICEVYKRTRQAQRHDFYKMVTEDLRYDCYYAEPWTSMKAHKIGPEELMRWEHFDMFCVPR